MRAEHAKDRDAYKRKLDILLLLLSHLLLLPMLLLLWTLIPLAIWLQDRGPVFYLQTRSGRNGKTFTLRKFRTMVPNADQLGPSWNRKDDTRITRFGRFLRRTGLDELPGLLSIWKGDMSLVGPRALAEKEQRKLESEIPGFSDRLRVLPGLTGLAQIYNTNNEDHEKLRYDRLYIQRMNVWLDLKLITLSVWNTITAKWDRRGGK